GLLMAGLGLTLGCDPILSGLCLPQGFRDPEAASPREYRTMAAPADSEPAEAVAPIAQPTPVSVPTPPADPLKQLQQRAAERSACIDSYIVRLVRREQVNGKDSPEETLLVKFRKEPWSVYFKWLGKQSQGREATYVKGEYENKIHTLLADGDMPFT